MISHSIYCCIQQTFHISDTSPPRWSLYPPGISEVWWFEVLLEFWIQVYLLPGILLTVISTATDFLTWNLLREQLDCSELTINAIAIKRKAIFLLKLALAVYKRKSMRTILNWCRTWVSIFDDSESGRNDLWIERENLGCWEDDLNRSL